MIGLDQDIEKDKAMEQAHLLYRYVKTAVLPSWACKELGGKDSPLDKGKEVFERLYQQRIKV